MRFNCLILSALAVADLLGDRPILVPVAAKSRPSGSRPSLSFPSSPSGSRPSFPSSPVSRPSAPSFNGRPSFNSRPAVKTPSGPIPATRQSPYNPHPAYKPLNSAGAPTVRSGGGGYGSTVKRVVAAAVAGAVAYAAVTIAAGYFLYGGRHSGPYCRGSDEDRFLTGRCPRGTSSQAHQCKTDIPLCSIPPLVRSKWALGSDAPPKLDVLFDKSVCSLVAQLKEDPVPAASEPVGAAAEVPAEPAPLVTEAPGSDPLVADEAAKNETATTPTLATVAATSPPVESELNTTEIGSGRRLASEVNGTSGLDACFRRILAAGGCSPLNMFLYDESSGDCGCCSSAQTLAAPDFASAVYGYRTDASLTSAPEYCISGSTMFYPDVAGGPDVAHACECGVCATCGGGTARYMDWSGPFVVPDSLGEVSFADAQETIPLFDPVDTCVCDDYSTVSQCELDGLEEFPPGSSAASVAGGALLSSGLAVASTTLFLFFGLVRKG